MLIRINISLIKIIAHPYFLIIIAFLFFIQYTDVRKQNECTIIQDQLKDKLPELQKKYDDRGLPYPELQETINEHCR